MSPPLLLGLAYSPWTIRARWALGHHKVEYRYREHVPMLGEGRLKRYAEQANIETPSVPMLVAGQMVVCDSYEIMCHADRIGHGTPLDAESDEAAELIDALDPMMRACRVRVTKRTLEDRDALAEAAEAAGPKFLAPMLRGVAAMGARHIAKKYGYDPEKADDGPLIAGLEHLAKLVAGGPYIGDRFGALDIIAASATNGIKPHARTAETMGPKTIEMWSAPELAERFAGLLAWREEIYAKHFPPEQGAK